MTPRKFPAAALVPNGGEIYCHIFENQFTGIARNLFWSITVEFAPLRYGEDEFTCSMTCEWIPWQIRDWQELDNRRLDAAYGEQGIESSFYMTRHDTGTRTKLALRQCRANVFGVQMEMVVDFLGYYGGDNDPAMRVHADVAIPFSGLVVIPGNLFPKPSTPAELRNVAAEFADLSRYKGPEPWSTHGSIFRPVVSD